MMRIVPAAIDLLLVLVFAIIGRATHEGGLSFVGSFVTAWPFLVAALFGWAVLNLLDDDGYLEATRRLGVSAADVLVIEDSVPGTQAALASGAVVYAVPALARLEQHPRMRVSATGLRHTTWTELVDFWMEREQ